VNGSGDNLVEQSRPLLQAEDIREATGGNSGLLEARDYGYFVVAMPNYWERTEISSYLRNLMSRKQKKILHNWQS
jgi:type IV secretion system protein VirD4